MLILNMYRMERLQVLDIKNIFNHLYQRINSIKLDKDIKETVSRMAFQSGQIYQMVQFVLMFNKILDLITPPESVI